MSSPPPNRTPVIQHFAVTMLLQKRTAAAGAGTNYGEVVSVVSCFLLVVSGLVVLARLAVKWSVSKRANADDILSLASLITNIGAGVAVTVVGRHGLGRDAPTLQNAELRIFEKVTLASRLLEIPARSG
ncbi:MAG: hypothetical protein M1822_009831 [Bathelium mastoideum]|nr:MAG: hypothetical protein M1822_009831 [Bathelium mastoideum]